MPITIRPLPLSIPRFSIRQVHRVTRRDDPALGWLRSIVHEACAPLRAL
jgi:hypothetical protein